MGFEPPGGCALARSGMAAVPSVHGVIGQIIQESPHHCPRRHDVCCYWPFWPAWFFRWAVREHDIDFVPTEMRIGSCTRRQMGLRGSRLPTTPSIPVRLPDGTTPHPRMPPAYRSLRLSYTTTASRRCRSATRLVSGQTAAPCKRIPQPRRNCRLRKVPVT